METEQIELQDLSSPPRKWVLIRRIWLWDVEHVGEWTWAEIGFLTLCVFLRPSCQRCPLKWEILASSPQGHCKPHLWQWPRGRFLLSKPPRHAPHIPLPLLPLGPQRASTSDPEGSTNAKSVAFSCCRLGKPHGGDTEIATGVGHNADLFAITTGVHSADTVALLHWLIQQKETQ